jgi:HlyD family secretion protein
MLAIAGGIAWWFFGRGTGPTEGAYEAFTVERRDLVRTVDLTGEIRPAARIALSFERSGSLVALHKAVGDTVAVGDLIAEIGNEDAMNEYLSAKANLAAARANYDKTLAGERTETIRIAESAVLQAEASLRQADVELDNTQKTVGEDVASAEIAVHTAENNLTTTRAELELEVRHAYDNARIDMLNAIGPMLTSLPDGDAIIGVDDTATNATYKTSLGVWTSGSMDRAKQSYLAAKPAANAAAASVKSLSSVSAESDIEAALRSLERALILVQAYLIDVQNVLAGSIASSALPSSTLDAKKTTINSDLSAIAAHLSNTVQAGQETAGANLARMNTMSDLEDEYATEKLNLTIATIKSDTSVRAAEANVAVKEAALLSARADLALKRAGPRDVDLAPLQAAIDDAAAKLAIAESNLKENQIIAPVDGTISDIIPEIGERVIANDTVVRMVGTQAFDIETLVPEADIATVDVGQRVTITLDAYGDDVVFDGTVLSEEPDQTLVEDAVYYRARVEIRPNGRDVKPGMTANVTVWTAEAPGVLVIPTRAVRRKENGENVVRVLEGSTIREAIVTLGLRGDEGRVAVLDGLKKGDVVLVSERTR